MRISSFILYGGLVRLGFSAYSIKDSYDSSNWLDMFTFSTVGLDCAFTKCGLTGMPGR